jgi:predicted oxidoreductase
MLKLAGPGERRFAYGFWRYLADEVDAAIAMLALVRESGIDHVDTADVYGGASGFGGAERLLGAVRARVPSLFEGAVLATKAGVELGTPYNSSADYLRAACDASLVRLGVERIDLFYVHRHDLLVHPADLAATLDGLVAAGKIAAVGVSNFTASQLEALTQYMKAPLVAHQIEFSAAYVEPIFDGLLDQAMRRGIALPAWSPLAGGRLGEASPAAELVKVCETLDALAKKYGLTRNAIAMAFIQRHPAGLTPIIGTKTPQRFRESLAGATCDLTRREWYDILEARLGRRMP